MNDEQYRPAERRPIASRELGVMQKLSAWLTKCGLSANTISVTSVFFAAGAGIALIATQRVDAPWMIRILWLMAAGMVQLRLLANLMDGMVAVASGKASKVGELYNEVPDRIADILILIGLGYAVGGSPTMGYGTALLAVFVAYVRAMGAVAGARQHFEGPMAKPHRMFLVTVLCLYCAVVPSGWQPIHPGSGWGAAASALLLISLGSVVTSMRRLHAIAEDLRNSGGEE